jgi:putative aminopeptidase FrvX
MHTRTSHLFQNLARIYNPSGDEGKMLQFIEKWLHDNGLENGAQITSDLEWGIHYSRSFCIPSETVGELDRGVLLAAHMDSDHIPAKEEDLHNVNFKQDGQLLRYDNKVQVGLDDKTGIVVLLNLLLKVRFTIITYH